jgi:hypothetical protein
MLHAMAAVFFADFLFGGIKRKSGGCRAQRLRSCKLPDEYRREEEDGKPPEGENIPEILMRATRLKAFRTNTCSGC